MTNKALILAAGFGSRLREQNKTPKPLQKVAGLPLIKRIILSASKAGINEFFIVVGFEKDNLIRTIQGYNLNVKITFIENNEWEKSNGVSVLSAKEYIKDNFVLLMSDHIFDPQIISEMIAAPLENNQVVLGVDFKLNEIFDMDDATKVYVNDHKIKNIGKNINYFNAVDTGIFHCTPALFDVLEKVYKQHGDVSLSDGVGALGDAGLFGYFDIRDHYWQDVDTPSALKHGEKILLQACRKSTDGFISRNFNRYISLFLSRFLMKTPLSANQITALISPIGILSGFLMAYGTYSHTVLGAILFKLSSVLDGCDGEISKLKMTSSKLGQWLDTASDNLTYVCFIVGTVLGLARQGDPNILIKGSITLFGLFMCMTVMFFYLVRHTNSGSLIAIQDDFQKENKPNFAKRLLQKLQFMIKRDFFATFFLILIIFGQTEFVIILCGLGSNTAWIVILSTILKQEKQEIVIPNESEQSVTLRLDRRV